MKYNTIPIPQFPFTDVPEREAESIANTYFQSTYNIGYALNTAKDDIRYKVVMQDSGDDRVVILSYLINKLTERILTLPEAKSPMEKNYRERDTIPTYTALLHFLYRLIEQEGIKIPTDLFDEESYSAKENLLLSIHESLEKIKTENPDKAEAIISVQEEIKKSNKFLWLGKEDWAKLVIGALIATSLKEGIMPHLPTLLIVIQNFVARLIDK